MKKKFVKLLVFAIILFLANNLFLIIYNEHNNKKVVDAYYNNPSSFNSGDMILVIPSIKLKRIVKHAKDDFSNLNNNLVYYKNNNSGGTIFIFGHSGMGYGTFFNRINELTINDICFLHIGKSKIKYKFISSYIVDEKDTDILEDKSDKLLLITCLKNNPKKRLVIEMKKSY